MTSQEPKATFVEFGFLKWNENFLETLILVEIANARWTHFMDSDFENRYEILITKTI